MKKRNKDIMSRSGKTSGSKDNMRRVDKDIMRQWGKDIKDIVCNSMAIKNVMKNNIVLEVSQFTYIHLVANRVMTL